MTPRTKTILLAVALVLVILLFVLIAIPVFFSGPMTLSAQEKSSAKLQVITSFRPITLLALPVAGDYAQVTQLLPAGAEPHEYEPTPDDAMTLAHGKILFYDGPFMEPWAENLAESANPQIVRAPFIDAIPPAMLAQMKSTNPKFPDTSQDPHLWLSPPLAEDYVSYIADQLAAADPANASGYYKNADAFEVRLKKLDRDYTTGLSNCTTRTFLTSHAFLDYQAAAYNLTALSITGLSPDAEPSVQQMAMVLNESRTDHVQGVLAETDEVQALSQSVATELNLPLYSYSTMEIMPSGAASPGDNDYVTIMENNLGQMRQALGCQ
jgi:zinc transport system substrate-binding protein